MAKKALPCPTVLRQLLRYEPETGKLFWKERGSEWFKGSSSTASRIAAGWNARLAGKEAFTHTSPYGYRVGALFDTSYLAHRLIWAMETGSWPEDQIDHINGVRVDNRIENLRDVSNQKNSRNMRRSTANRSGVTGVHWVSRRSHWVAVIGRSGGKSEYLGSYATVEDAAVARKAAEVRHGYHKNHGKDGNVEQNLHRPA